jgi:pyruvate kinase
MIKFNKTKIVATIGPASSSRKVLKDLILAGVDVCRLNLSHGDYEHHAEVFKSIREINDELNLHTAILVDLQGPKLRIGEVGGGQTKLEDGAEVILTTQECVGRHDRLYITYPEFPKDVKVGDRILIDDGKIQLTVTVSNATDEVKAKVIHGGVLASRKGVNLPNTKISLPSLTDKDKEDLQFALENEVDWIGLSFVRSALDIIELKNIIARKGKRARVIAKIEKPEALSEIDAILRETDALMVARGDLGVELPMHEVPLIQKMLVNKCIKASKPVIIATQMMESMISNFAPTRAEVSDVANSVLDGADAVMLSGETSVGAFPVKVVEAMRSVITTVERKAYPYNRPNMPEITSDTYISDSVCYHACVMASQAGAKAITGITRSGYTAFKVSSHRPQADILIFTDNLSLLPVLSLVWGVRGFYYDRSISTDDTIHELQEILKDRKLVRSDDTIINLASIPLGEQGRTNMIKLGRVK